MDFGVLSTILVISILLFISKKGRTQTQHSTGKANKPLPPGPPRWPLVGNLFQLSPLPHRDLTSFCDQYGPIVYLRLGNVDAITTNDPNVIREILTRQDDVFASRPRTLAAVHLAYNCGDVALAPMGPKWKRMRRICMEHLLTTKRLESFSKSRVEEAQHLVQDVFAKSQNGSVNMREVLGAFSMNNVTRMLLGKQYYGVEMAGPEEAKEFMHITHDVFWFLGLIYLGDYLPFWRWWDPYGCERRMREVEKRMDGFHNKILEEHKRAREKRQRDGILEDPKEMDFVDILLSLHDEDGKPQLEDVEIKALIQDMIAAGTDTSAVSNEWAMTEIIRHPRVLQKIQSELDTLVGPSRMVSESDLPHLTYLRCVVREIFRLHPAGPFLIPHESLTQTEINDYHIPRGTRVFINTYAMGRNKSLWDRPEEFRPERHLPSDGGMRVELNHGTEFMILPFGAGKRKCPGAPLGVTLVLVAIATLCHCFDWQPPEGVKPEEVDIKEVYGMTSPKVEPLLARAKPRLAPHMYR